MQLDVQLDVQRGVDRRKTVGVMGSGSEEHEELAGPLGELVARIGANLLTGGGAGVMAAASRAFCGVEPRAGVSIGVLPARENDLLCTPKPGYPNPWIEVPVRTHLPYSGASGTHERSRNHINILSSDAVVALPGGAGTASEVALALRYRKPVVAYLAGSNTISGLDPAVLVVASIAEVEAFLREALVC